LPVASRAACVFYEDLLSRGISREDADGIFFENAVIPAEKSCVSAKRLAAGGVL